MEKVTDVYSALVFDEGEKLYIYPDIFNYLTAGVGHLLVKSDDMAAALDVLDKLVGRSTGGSITKEESEAIFNQDVAKVKAQIAKSSILSPIFNKLDSVRQAGIINMCFQMGTQGTEAFKNSLTLVANKQYTQAKTNLLKSAWASQTPNRAKRVIDTLVTGTFDSYNG